MINEINIAPETQHRAEHCQAHIANLMESISEGIILSPITVIENKDINNKEDRFYLIDGYHRLEANILSGLCDINAKIINIGNKDLAIELSLSANAEHAPALPRNADDLKKACENCCAFLHKRNKKIYNDFKKDIKTSEISKKYNLSEKTIRKIKKDKEKENIYEEKRSSGWNRSRNRTLPIINNPISSSNNSSSLKHINRHSYSDHLAERDIRNYLVNLRLFDGANAAANKTNMYIYGGQVDILGDYELVEVKRFGTLSNIYQAIGQIISYGLKYPNKQKVIACLLHDDINQFLKYEILKKLDIKLLIVNPDGSTEYLDPVNNSV